MDNDKPNHQQHIWQVVLLIPEGKVFIVFQINNFLNQGVQALACLVRAR
jgi:alkylated DNA nucleotide flippase Atl1